MVVMKSRPSSAPASPSPDRLDRRSEPLHCAVHQLGPHGRETKHEGLCHLRAPIEGVGGQRHRFDTSGPGLFEHHAIVGAVQIRYGVQPGRDRSKVHRAAAVPRCCLEERVEARAVLRSHPP
jgi:hypothetical protein